MKNKHLAILLLSSCCWVSCVDDKYDLSDVNTDELTMGESWVSPLGTGSVLSDDVVDVKNVPSIREIDGAYVMVYNGELTIQDPLQRTAASGWVEIAMEEINTGDIDNLFEGDFVLALVNPHVTLTSAVKGSSLDCSLDVEAISGEQRMRSSSPFTFSTSQSKIWFGPLDPKLPAYTFVENKQLPAIVQIIPQQLNLSLYADATQWQQAPADALSQLRYSVELPLQPAPSFNAVSVERIENVFDADFVDYIFSDGSATIFGTVTNEMPFDMMVEMRILDMNYEPLAITMPMQEVKGTTGEVAFQITGEDMPKMIDARHIDMVLHLSGREQGEVLKKGQKTTFQLKLKKEGGISI